jgi:hypothetical protein
MARLFRYVGPSPSLAKGGPGWTVASVALLLVQATLPLLALHTMKLVVDTVVGGPATADKGSAFGRVAKGYYR